MIWKEPKNNNMKRLMTLLIAGFLLLSWNQVVDGQIRVDLRSKVNRAVNQRANEKADEAIKAGLDKTEEGIKNAVTGKEKAEGAENQAGEKPDQAVNAGAGNAPSGQAGRQSAGKETAVTEPEVKWAKYDFVPGDKVIFEDNQTGEENGEFPSRWDLANGNVEIAKFGGDNVIMFRGNASSIVPYLKNPEKDYLPDVFTIELDLYKPGGSFEIYLFDRKNQRTGANPTRFVMWSNDMECHSAKSTLPENKNINNRWVHIAIAYTDGKLKGYIDDTRLINIPHSEFNPLGLTLYCYHASDNNRVYVKNVRIAEGGVKYYDRVLQDGKIIVNGIRFDVGKATLRQESMGAINEIYNLMKENPDLKFSVEGHTDSQGDDAFNMKLSQERAETVMNTLIKLGIPAEKLSAKGWGESRPVSNNASPEDMANNRRVEFVKI